MDANDGSALQGVWILLRAEAARQFFLPPSLPSRSSLFLAGPSKQWANMVRCAGPYEGWRVHIWAPARGQSFGDIIMA